MSKEIYLKGFKGRERHRETKCVKMKGNKAQLSEILNCVTKRERQNKYIWDDLWKRIWCIENQSNMDISIRTSYSRLKLSKDK